MLNFLCELFSSRAPEWISALSALVGFIVVFRQLKASKDIARLQFEDGINKEYRELTSKIVTKAWLGGNLSPAEYKASFDDFFRYFDLCNEQAFLFEVKRIDEKTWQQWREGIVFNLSLPAFKKAWDEVYAAAPNQFSKLAHVLNQDQVLIQ